MEERNEQFRNADGPIHRTLEVDAKLTSESLVQVEKQLSESISTEHGMQIDDRDEHSRNADGPIDDNWQ
jgi:hypothetical protein